MTGTDDGYSDGSGNVCVGHHHCSGNEAALADRWRGEGSAVVRDGEINSGNAIHGAALNGVDAVARGADAQRRASGNGTGDEKKYRD